MKTEHWYGMDEFSKYSVQTLKIRNITQTLLYYIFFGNVVLVTLFVFFKNTCAWKKYVKIRIMLYKH